MTAPRRRRAAARPASPPGALSIEVTPAPPAEGSVLSPFAAPVRPSAANVAAFHADPAQMARAAEALQRLGFRVLIRSRLSISVEVPPGRFTEVFGTALEARTFASAAAAPLRASHARFWAPAPGAAWTPPAPLAGLVDRAYIQRPYIYFGATAVSPLPPRPDRHHLRVPGDVALLTNAAAVHRLGTTGRGVKVAMIDSGFAFDHPYYVRNGYNLARLLAPGAVDLERDENGHGTAEAANVLAIAPDCTFIGIKAGPNLTAAFKEAVRQSPQIITVSMGFDLRGEDGLPLPELPGNLRALEAEVADAVASGIAVVFSAGNGHISFPGMHPDVISAGGAYVDAAQRLEASDYASAFDSVIYPSRHVPDLAGLVGKLPHADYILLPLAAGCELDEDLAGHDDTSKRDGWSLMSGTSAAAPQLAGVCALLKQKNPGLTPGDLKAILQRTAVDVTRGAANPSSNPVRSGKGVKRVALKAGTGPDGATGAGLVDALAAWKQA